MRRGQKQVGLVAGLLILCASSYLYGTVIPFDSGDLGRFTYHGSFGYALAPGAGTGGSSGLTTSTFPCSAAFNLPFSNAIGNTNTISLDFFNTNTLTPNGLDMRLAFVPSTSVDFTGFSSIGKPSMTVELRYPGPGQRDVTFFNNDTSGTIGGGFATSSGYVLNQWYRLEFSLTREPDNSGFAVYRAGIKQWSLGATGTSTPTLIQQNTSPLILSSSFITPNLYGGFVLTPSNSAYDNFSLTPNPIPEPAGVMVIGVGGLMLGRRRVR